MLYHIHIHIDVVNIKHSLNITVEKWGTGSHEIYSISQEICTRFYCALLCCGYAIVHNEFTCSIYHVHQGCFAGTGAIVRLPQCQWSKPDGYGKISQCITKIKHSKAKTVCIFLGIYCRSIQELRSLQHSYQFAYNYQAKEVPAYIMNGIC